MTWIREKIGYGLIRFGSAIQGLGVWLAYGKAGLILMTEILQDLSDEYIDNDDDCCDDDGCEV